MDNIILKSLDEKGNFIIKYNKGENIMTLIKVNENETQVLKLNQDEFYNLGDFIRDIQIDKLKSQINYLTCEVLKEAKSEESIKNMHEIINQKQNKLNYLEGEATIND